MSRVISKLCRIILQLGHSSSLPRLDSKQTMRIVSLLGRDISLMSHDISEMWHEAAELPDQRRTGTSSFCALASSRMRAASCCARDRVAGSGDSLSTALQADSASPNLPSA